MNDESNKSTETETIRNISRRRCFICYDFRVFFVLSKIFSRKQISFIQFFVERNISINQQRNTDSFKTETLF